MYFICFTIPGLSLSMITISIPIFFNLIFSSFFNLFTNSYLPLLFPNHLFCLFLIIRRPLHHLYSLIPFLSILPIFPFSNITFLFVPIFFSFMSFSLPVPRPSICMASLAAPASLPLPHFTTSSYQHFSSSLLSMAASPSLTLRQTAPRPKIRAPLRYNSLQQLPSDD